MAGLYGYGAGEMDNKSILDKPVGGSASDIADAIAKKHTQGTDTTLGAMTADINMNTHQLTALSAPDANGEAIRQTAKITEAALETAIDEVATWTGLFEIDINGDLEPVTDVQTDAYYELDANDDIMPKAA